MGNQINIQNNNNLSIQGDLTGGDKVSVNGDLTMGNKTIHPIQFQNSGDQEKCFNQLNELRHLVLKLRDELEDEKEELADEATSQSREIKRNQTLVKNLEPNKPAEQKQSQTFFQRLTSLGEFMDRAHKQVEKAEKLANKVIPLIEKAKPIITTLLG